MNSLENLGTKRQGHTQMLVSSMTFLSVVVLVHSREKDFPSRHILQHASIGFLVYVIQDQTRQFTAAVARDTPTSTGALQMILRIIFAAVNRPVYAFLWSRPIPKR